MRKRLVFLVIAAMIGVTGYSYIIDHHDEPNHTVPQDQTIQTTGTAPITPSTITNKEQQPDADPNSLSIVVNKQRQLQPKEFIPSDLVKPEVAQRSGTQVSAKIAKALQQLFTAANANHTPLLLSSGYRSYSYQVGLYNGYVSAQGKAMADSESARPGYSEHQTGLAADVSPLKGECSIKVCFADTPAGKWLADNSYKYGFIIRYNNSQTATTGYAYEPWHIRYVGNEVATKMHDSNIATLEQYYKLPAAPNY